MIKGATQLVSSETSVPAGTVTVPLISYVAPGQSAVSAVATLNVTTRDLEYALTTGIAGLWTLSWTANYGTNVFIDNNMLPVTILNIKAMVIANMKINESAIDDSTFNKLLSGMLTYWLGILEITDYNAMDLTDAVMFDTGLSLIMTCFMKPYLGSSSTLQGELASVGTGLDRVSFHRRYSEISTDSQFNDCMNRAWIYFNMITGVMDATIAAADHDLFVAAGRRRYLRGRLGNTNDLNPLYGIFQDQLLEYMYVGGWANGLAS